jgi:hypothetical protein
MQLYTRAPFALRVEHDIPCENLTESRLFYAKVLYGGAVHLPHLGGIQYEQISMKTDQSPKARRFDVNNSWFYLPITGKILRYEDFIQICKSTLSGLGFYTSDVTQRFVTQQNASPLATVEILHPGVQIDQMVVQPFSMDSRIWKRLYFVPALEFYRFGWRKTVDVQPAWQYFKWNTYSEVGCNLYELDFFQRLLKDAEEAVVSTKPEATTIEWVAELAKRLEELSTDQQKKDLHDFVSQEPYKIICDERFVKLGRIAFNSPPSYARSVAIMLNKLYYK